MNKNMGMGIAALLLALAAGGVGHWWGARQAGSGMVAMPEAADNTPPARKIRFYRNPMGLADTSPVPKKDSMGMDYIPVFEGEDQEDAAPAGQMRFSAQKVQKMGVRTEPATLRTLDKVVRASGRIEADESRTFTIAPRFEGYVEKLLVNTTGQAVRKGQPLFEVYAPELVAAQREYAIAMQGVQSLAQAGPEAQKSMQQLAEASLLRLRNWEVSEEQVKELARTGAARHTLTFRSPVSGFVSEKKAMQGMRFMPGEALYQVSDLSSVWVLADVPEQDIAAVKTGARARVAINAYPDKTFEAALTYVYPTLNAETRSVPVRLELRNPGGLLKPGMFAQVELPVGGNQKVLTVPLSAVIDSGLRQTILVQQGQPDEGRFVPRQVRLGARSESYVEVLDGLQEGEAVVVSANFLIDAESNLKAAIAGFGDATQPAAMAPDAMNKENKEVTKPGAAAVGHRGEGTLLSLDAKALSLNIRHGPIATLQWPAMTMDFAVANSDMLKALKPGAPIAFEFVERAPGEWVITKLMPQPAMGKEK